MHDANLCTIFIDELFLWWSTDKRCRKEPINLRLDFDWFRLRTVLFNLKAGIEAATGTDIITGREIGNLERAALVAAIFGGPLVKGGIKVVKWGGKLFSKVKNIINPQKVKTVVDGIFSKVTQGFNSLRNTAGELMRKIEDVRIPLQSQFALAGSSVGVIRTNGGITSNVNDTLVRVSSSVRGEVGKGTGNVKHLNNVPRIKEIEVTFKRNVKHDSNEFARQLKDQEKGMNELTVDEYLRNRERYIAEGRAIEGNAAQKMVRQEALKDKVAELRKQGLSRADATKQASDWMDTQAALHNPDQIAGGRTDMISGLGDKRVNSSLGLQWKYRIDIVDEQIRSMAKIMSPNEKNNTYLNVKLIQ